MVLGEFVDLVGLVVDYGVNIFNVIVNEFFVVGVD